MDLYLLWIQSAILLGSYRLLKEDLCGKKKDYKNNTDVSDVLIIELIVLFFEYTFSIVAAFFLFVYMSFLIFVSLKS